MAVGGVVGTAGISFYIKLFPPKPPSPLINTLDSNFEYTVPFESTISPPVVTTAPDLLSDTSRTVFLLVSLPIPGVIFFSMVIFYSPCNAPIGLN